MQKPIIYNNKVTNYVVDENGVVQNLISGRILTNYLTMSGRYSVCLSIDGEPYLCPVHVLVYRAFYGEIPFGMTINHIDEDRLNNNYKNLELLTREENIKSYLSSKNDPFIKKYDDYTIESICQELKNGMHYRDLSFKYNIPIDYIYSIVKGKRRKNIVKKYLPFPKSSYDMRNDRQLPKDCIKMMIINKKSTQDILNLLELEDNGANRKYIGRIRKRLGIKDPKYFTDQTISTIDELIKMGYTNAEIYKFMNFEYNSRNSDLIARRRQKLLILNDNSKGISLEVQRQIMSDIELGLSNSNLKDKYNLSSSKYTTNLFARLRQKVKKKSSETIES